MPNGLRVLLPEVMIIGLLAFLFVTQWVAARGTSIQKEIFWWAVLSFSNCVYPAGVLEMGPEADILNG